jgi:hypothetical protein
MAHNKLATVFNGPVTYPHTIISNPYPTDECFICKTPYLPHDPEGCTAIRLTHCNHTIGLSCFQQWVSRVPNTCPYWSHPLPSTQSPQYPNENLFTTVLRWLVTSAWMNRLETFHAEHFFGALKGKAVPLVINTFHALANGQLTVKHAKVIMYYYTLFLSISLILLPALWLVAVGILQILSLAVFGLGWHGIVWKHACGGSWGLGDC